MSFSLPEHWVWDFWFADDGERHHLFYLHAPKSLGDPNLRHRNARIGHASSTDLRTWDNHGQVFDAGPAPSFDGSATWTGSVLKGPDGLWRMFYTGSRFLSPDTATNIETVGVATSPDLMVWEKQPGPICSADSQWYETLGTSSWPEEAWRDPWVFRNDADNRWDMLITARAKTGADDDRGVVGHAISTDLATWQVQAPLSAPGAGFGHLEVFQVIEIGGRTHLIFCCDAAKLGGARTGETGGVWSQPIDAMPATVDPRAARLLVPEALYAGRAVIDRDGRPFLMAFHNVDADGKFGGGISDPIPLAVGPDGYLEVAEAK